MTDVLPAVLLWMLVVIGAVVIASLLVVLVYMTVVLVLDLIEEIKGRG